MMIQAVRLTKLNRRQIYINKKVLTHSDNKVSTIYHLHTLTVSSTEPVTMFSDPSFSDFAHAQLHIPSS